MIHTVVAAAVVFASAVAVFVAAAAVFAVVAAVFVVAGTAAVVAVVEEELRPASSLLTVAEKHQQRWGHSELSRS